MRRHFNNKGLIGLSPLLFFLLFYLGAAFITGDFQKVPIALAFFLASIYAVLITDGLSLPDRVREYGRGAGATKVMFMIWIFLTAGVFASTAEAMGCVNETVNAILKMLPAKYLYVGLYVATCVISMATGSGIGSIVAVGPVAIGAAEAVNLDMPLVCSIVICGAMFGDNLSFISDTTVIATTSQGCQLKDKFRANIWLAAPAFIACLVIYYLLGCKIEPITIADDIQYIKIIPYFIVILLSVLGVDVFVVLLSGCVACLVMGLSMGSFDFIGWMAAANDGMESISSLVLIILMASGLLALIKKNGGIDALVSLCLKFAKGRKSAELCIALLSFFFCLCTANNTIAIISVSEIAKDLSTKFGIAPQRSASLMDTCSCVALEIVPYGTHLLVIAGMARIATATMIPTMYYAFFMALMVILSFFIKLPGQQLKENC